MWIPLKGRVLATTVAAEQPDFPLRVNMTQEIQTRINAPAPVQITTQSTQATPLPRQPLRYLSRQLVDMTNIAEVQLFQQFMVENYIAPQSRPALRAYCQCVAAATPCLHVAETDIGQ